MGTRVSEPKARLARTAGQATPAWIVTELIDVFAYDLDDRQYGVVCLALTALFSFLQTWYENRSGQALLRAPNIDVPLVTK